MLVVDYRSWRICWVVFLAALVWGCVFAGCNRYEQSGTSGGRPLVGEFQAREENPLLNRREKATFSQQAVHLSVYLVVIGQEEEGKVEDVWSLVGGAQLVGNNGQFLAQNGLRIGAGGGAELAKVVELLETTAGGRRREQARRIDTYLGRDFVAELLLGESADGLTLFRHRTGGGLVGKTYTQCQRLLLATALVEATGQVRLKMVPVLKAAGARIKTLQRLAALGRMEAEAYLGEFEELAFDVLVGKGEFLVIGSTESSGDLSFGRAFFDSQDTATSAKMVMLVIPQVLAEESSR